MSAEKTILGIDEVGRGPWAGPLVVGAVLLGPEFQKSAPDAYDKLADSKKLSRTQREELAPAILAKAAASATGWVPAAELDKIGLSASLKLATRRAVKQVLAQITAQNHQCMASTDPRSQTAMPAQNPLKFDEIIIDGTSNSLVGTPLADRVTILKKADALVKEVSAASIIAKVARDDYMTKISTQYPAYSFEKHVGYGTAAHRSALEKHGICPEHRQSFRPIHEILAHTGQTAENARNASRAPSRARSSKNAPFSSGKPIQNSPKSPQSASGADFRPVSKKAPSHTANGKTAELAVLEWLEEQNHQIIAHNFRTKAYEIDLISVKNEQIFFTEVKYSKNLRHEANPLVRITAQKQTQMRFAAESFLATHPQYQKLQPLLAAAAVSGDNFQVDNWFPL